ncbi:MAG: hypothetical protein U0869_20210 [Chloroflexota bacterium]
MIVVVGRPGLGAAGVGGERPPAGLAALVAVAAARAGAKVELVGAVGEDPDGDSVVVALGRAGVGHAAVLRDPAGATPSAERVGGARLPRLDAADIELGMRYLAACEVVVVADPLDEAAAGTLMDAAAYHGAQVVVVAAPGAAVPAAWDRGATVLAAPEPDPDDEPSAGRPGVGAVDEAWVGLVSGFAVALESGVAPQEALKRAVAGGGWERAPDDEDAW